MAMSICFGAHLLLPAFSICCFWLSVALAQPVRCSPEGYYQSALLVFSCDGSTGQIFNNQVSTDLIASGSWSETVPKGTRNLYVTADAVRDVSLDLYDPQTRWPIGRDAYVGGTAPRRRTTSRKERNRAVGGAHPSTAPSSAAWPRVPSPPGQVWGLT